MSYDFEGKRVFLSGPMTGYPGWNRAEFARVTAAVCQRGAVEVHNPAANVPAEGEELPHESYMLDSLQVLTASLTDIGGARVPYWDVVVMLDGWADSDGAWTEGAVAEACGIECADWGDCE